MNLIVVAYAGSHGAAVVNRYSGFINDMFDQQTVGTFDEWIEEEARRHNPQGRFVSVAGHGWEWSGENLDMDYRPDGVR